MAFNAGVPEDVGVLDLLNVFSLWAQVDNMSMDKQQTAYIRTVIKAIADEIEKLHKENDIIIKQNEEILEELRRRDVSRQRESNNSGTFKAR